MPEPFGDSFKGDAGFNSVGTEEMPEVVVSEMRQAYAHALLVAFLQTQFERSHRLARGFSRPPVSEASISRAGREGPFNARGSWSLFSPPVIKRNSRSNCISRSWTEVASFSLLPRRSCFANEVISIPPTGPQLLARGDNSFRFWSLLLLEALGRMVSAIIEYQPQGIQLGIVGALRQNGGSLLLPCFDIGKIDLPYAFRAKER